MICLSDCRPVSFRADDAPPAAEECGPRRWERLQKLSENRASESRAAQHLCRELWFRFPDGGGKGSSFVLEENRYGKPYLLHSSLHVSLSHSGGCAAAAVADVPVGIDLQQLRDISPAVLRRMYSPEEIRWIEAAKETEARRRAVRLWTMKEAYGKLRGVGIFSKERFFASFRGGRLLRRYPGVRFLFPDAPEGLLFTVCLAAGSTVPSVSEE